MTFLTEFLANPPEFLRHNHVTYKGQNPPNAGIYWFLLVPVRSATARMRASVFLGRSVEKADAGVYEIRYRDSPLLTAQRRADGLEFEAHWGGYLAGGKAQCALDGTGPDIMLTPELTGCAIAFSATQDGHARFSHYNLKTGTRTQAAPGMVREARIDYAGEDYGVLTKEHYYGKSSADMRDTSEIGVVGKFVKGLLPARKHAKATANVLGWRNGGQWTFWIQYSDMKGAAHQILDVKQLTPGVRIG